MPRRSPPIRDIRLRADRVDHRAGGEEQQRLERGVGEQVEQRGGRARRRRARRSCSRVCDTVDQASTRLMSSWAVAASAPSSMVIAAITPSTASARRRRREQRVEPGHHVDAGGDHRGGVDQRGDRRRAGHRVGQPGVQRELGALAGHPGEQQQARRRSAVPASSGRAASTSAIRKLPASTPSSAMPSRKPTSPTRVTRNAFTAARGRLGQRAVVADQQVRADAHDLPADQQQDQVAGDHDQQHRAR